MARSFKLKCHRFISSFQFCRPKRPLTFLGSPFPVSYHQYKQSLANPIACDICYPNPPAPPPSTPVDFFSCHLSPKIISVCLCCKLKSCTLKFSRGCRTKPLDYTRKNGPHVAQKGSKSKTEHKVYSDENQRSASKSWTNKKKSTKKNKDKKKAKLNRCRDKPTANCWSNGYDGEEDEETEALINSSKSFDDFSHKWTDSMKNTNEISRSKDRNLELPRMKESNTTEVQDMKRGSGNEITKTAATLLEDESPTGKTVMREKLPGRVVEGKLRESFVLVKRSKQPYEEFKRSMVQMILEEDIFEAKGLEELLRCYLTLNSPEYHGVIVEAFSEVWEFLFCDSHVNKSNAGFARNSK